MGQAWGQFMLTGTRHAGSQGRAGLTIVKGDHLWCCFCAYSEKRISAPERKIHRVYCNQKYSENEYVLHRGKCYSVSESGKHHPSGKPKILPLSFPSEPAGNQTSTAERDVHPKTKYRKKFPRFSENSTQKAQRNKNRTMNLPLKAEHKPKTAFLTEDEAAYDILRGCSQCGILLPLPTLCQHQEKCLRLASWKGKQVRKSS
ncbi:XIAP-associated factor 1 [Marmota monax]|uniref:XIAP-associated factor 1 n=1 Tax=Marmota monax TaxID=9995 RepID=A0A834Q5J9_MARMO|nr:XIAP-associated factor 1 [Marmota monax]